MSMLQTPRPRHHNAARHQPVTAVWYTWELDGPLVLESIKCLLTVLPTAQPWVIEDSNRPLLSTHREALAHLGAEIRGTVAPRHGNLNGPGWFRTQHSAMLDVVTQHGSTWALKVDSDTLVFRPDPMLTVMDSGTVHLAGGSSADPDSPRHLGIFGAAYGISAAALESLSHTTVADAAAGGKICEDVETARQVSRIFGPACVHLWSTHSSTGWLGSYTPTLTTTGWHPPTDLHRITSNYNAITVCRPKRYPTVTSSRATVLMAMKALRSHLPEGA